MNVWRDPETGRLIRDQDGKLVRSATSPCCCFKPVPSACPCTGTWPPASWPCGGLLEQYAVDYQPPPGFFLGIRFAGLVVTAFSYGVFDTCRWEGTGSGEYSLDGGATFGGSRLLNLGAQGKRSNELETWRLGQCDGLGFVFRLTVSAKVAKAIYQGQAEIEVND